MVLVFKNRCFAYEKKDEDDLTFPRKNISLKNGKKKTWMAKSKYPTVFIGFNQRKIFQKMKKTDL